MRLKNALLWVLLVIDGIWSILFFLYYTLFSLSVPIVVIFLAIPVGLALLHAQWSLGIRGTAIFFLLASNIGWFFEYTALSTSRLFGGEYKYTTTIFTQYQIGNVPIAVILYWFLFLYLSYCCTNYFFLNQKVTYNAKQSLDHRSTQLTTKILSDALFLTIIDIFMDPVQVKIGSWQWVRGGKFFQVPLGNFLTWFVLAVIFSSIWRMYENRLYFQNMKTDDISYLIPVLCYTKFLFLFFLFAVYFQLEQLMIVEMFILVFLSLVVVLNRHLLILKTIP